MKIIAQPYRGEDDYARMRTLLQEIYAIGGPSVYCSMGDLDWWRFKYENPDFVLILRGSAKSKHLLLH